VHPAPRLRAVSATALIVFFSFALHAHGSGKEPRGSVDWTGGFVVGIGYGTAKPSGNKVTDRLNAVRAAEVTAQRALAEAVHGVRIDGAMVMREAIREYVLESRVQGVIRGAQKVREEVSWDGGTPMATVELRVCLAADSPGCRPGASLMEIVASGRRNEPSYVPAERYDRGTGSPGLPGAAVPVTGTVVPGDGPPSQMSPVSYDSSRPVTGLLLLVEGVRFERELFPVVVTRGEGGKFLAVYSAKSVRPEVVRSRGVARYADTLQQAMHHPLVGDNPLVLLVTEVARPNMLVLRSEGAKAVRETIRHANDYLSEAKVVVAGR